MLFNSTEFILFFMPLTLLGFLALRGYSRELALGWLILASLGFYAWWRPLNVAIIVPSILVDFAIARLMVAWADDESRVAARRALLITGIALNLGLLGYFKYTTFFQQTLNDVAGTDFALTYVILPLGLSFITFQKIAFLVDVHGGGQVDRFSFREYCLFILFFPQVIAGPIVHFREMMPQFRALPERFDRDLLAAGIALFIIGLFKKVALADGIAEHVNPLYIGAAAGGTPLIQAWQAALGFTMQIYFDFSGYSDMAAGLALCIGVRLPLNFFSPLKATNIIDFWNHWHISLTRFLTAYVYNPITLTMTRRRMRRRKPGLGPKHFHLGAFVTVLALPTAFTMFVSGLWHGAGYMFVLWGLIHGGYLVINHAWRRLGPAARMDSVRYDRVMRPVGFVLTFLAVTVAMVVFRAPDLNVATDIFRGMVGLNGLELPESLVAALGIQASLPTFVGVGVISLQSLALLVLLLAICLLLPNSMEFTARYQPTLGVERDPEERRLVYRILDFQPGLLWGAAVGMLGVVAVLRFGGPSEFLYWQF